MVLVPAFLSPSSAQGVMLFLLKADLFQLLPDKTMWLQTWERACWGSREDQGSGSGGVGEKVRICAGHSAARVIKLLSLTAVGMRVPCLLQVWRSTQGNVPGTLLPGLGGGCLLEEGTIVLEEGCVLLRVGSRIDPPVPPEMRVLVSLLVQHGRMG